MIFVLAQLTAALQLLVKDQGIDDWQKGRHEDGPDRQPEWSSEDDSEQAKQSSREEGLGGYPMGRVPHALVRNRPGRTDADEKIAAHLAQHVSEQGDQQADTTFHRATHID